MDCCLAPPVPSSISRFSRVIAGDQEKYPRDHIQLKVYYVSVNP